MARHVHAGHTFDAYKDPTKKKWGVRFVPPKPRRPGQRTPEAEGAHFATEKSAREAAVDLLDGNRPKPPSRRTS